MVTLDTIREMMAQRLEEDKSRVFVEVTGDTLEQALEDASVQLGIQVRDIDYEVLQRGANGFFARITSYNVCYTKLLRVP